MRRIILVIALTVLSALWAAANSGPYRETHKTNMHKMDVTGCVFGSAGALTLVDAQGNTFELTGHKTDRLEGRIGQRVHISGKTWFDPEKPGAMSGKAGAIRELHVSHILGASGERCAE